MRQSISTCTLLQSDVTPLFCVDLLFSAEKRKGVQEEMKKANPDMKQTDVMRKIAEMWKNVDPELKQVCPHMPSLFLTVNVPIRNWWHNRMY